MEKKLTENFFFFFIPNRMAIIFCLYLGRFWLFFFFFFRTLLLFISICRHIGKSTHEYPYSYILPANCQRNAHIFSIILQLVISLAEDWGTHDGNMVQFHNNNDDPYILHTSTQYKSYTNINNLTTRCFSFVCRNSRNIFFRSAPVLSISMCVWETDWWLVADGWWNINTHICNMQWILMQYNNPNCITCISLSLVL